MSLTRGEMQDLKYPCISCNLASKKVRLKEDIMDPVDVTKLSSKGQIVLPLNIRQKLRLNAGEQFVVVGDKDTIILKKLELPDMSQFKQLVSASRKWARKVGLKKSDITNAIRRVRAKARNS